MHFNDKFSMKDLFMNKELKNIFPQFSKRDKLQNVYSYAWIEDKVASYIRATFNGKLVNGEIVIRGKFKEKFREIKGLKQVIEDMFNNIPAITKNIRKNTKLITPFQCVEQLKQITESEKKIAVMQIIFDNLNYNPEFQSQGRFSNQYRTLDYFKRQKIWMDSVGYDKIRRK